MSQEKPKENNQGESTDLSDVLLHYKAARAYYPHLEAMLKNPRYKGYLDHAKHPVHGKLAEQCEKLDISSHTSRKAGPQNR